MTPEKLKELRRIATTIDKNGLVPLTLAYLGDLLDYIETLEKQCTTSAEAIARLGATIKELQEENLKLKSYLRRPWKEISIDYYKHNGEIK